MSTSIGPSPGPLRPIPIHVVRNPGLEADGFRHPMSMDKPTRPNPPLWNPALDLSPSPRKTILPGELNLSTTSNIMEHPPSTSSSSLSSIDVQNLSTKLLDVQPTGVKCIHKREPSLGGALKTPPLTGALLYEQLHLHFPGSVENPLAILASKGLFPTFLGVQDTILPCPNHVLGHNLTALPMPISERHLTMPNSLSLAQTRALMERMSSAHSQNTRLELMQQQSRSMQLHHQSHRREQRSPGSQLAIQSHRRSIPRPDRSTSQPYCLPSHPEGPPLSIQSATTAPNAERSGSLHTTTLPSSERHLQQINNTSTPASERHVPIHSAFSHAHSRALLERISNNPILSPIVSIDNAVAHGYGRKLFPCPQCRYTTDRRNNLKRHMLTMHQTSAKMLECCGILFNTKASLREHAMIFHYHGYTCYFCGRRFCRKALLKRHLSVHNGQKDFVCDVCDYATSHKSNLERHRKVHMRQDDAKDGEDGHQYHDEVKSSGSEVLSHGDASCDDLSVCSDYEDEDDDTDVEINVHSD